MQAPEADRPLEDHLRNLILNNTENNKPGTPTNEQVTRAGREDGGNQPRQSSTGVKSIKRRPNQAQRRQMSAQLSIPLDPGAASSQPLRSHVTPSVFDDHRPGHGPSPGPHHGPPHHHHPSGFRGGFRGHSLPPQHMHDQPFTHQPHYKGGFDSNATVSPNQPFHQQGWRGSNHPQRSWPSRGVNVLQADAFVSRPPRNTHGSLYNPAGHRQYAAKPEEIAAQASILDDLCTEALKDAEIELSEIAEKEKFRAHVEEICRAVVSHQEINGHGSSWFQPQSVQLKCFGSLASGFATKAADMDLGLLSPESLIPPDAPESPIPRLLEKALLEAGFGARLLTRTRVPIIKLCQKPTKKLRHDLLEERARWEQGLTDEDRDIAEDDADIHNNDKQEVAIVDDMTASVGKASSATDQQGQHLGVHLDKPDDSARLQQLASLKQRENQTLADYYAVAKRTLQRMNGRDVSKTNASHFKDGEFMLLDEVSAAFIDGLHDSQLKDCIKSYPSFSAGRSKPNYRTLQGVFNMAEGAQLVMLWMSGDIPEANVQAEQSPENWVQSWSSLQLRRSFGTDPLTFQQDLHSALEKLRNVPSMQLIQLQQNEDESPTNYHLRTVKIVSQLSAIALAASEPGIIPPVIRYYVSGIREQGIRDRVAGFVRASGTKNLRAVAVRHKSLHLAVEYERAIEKELYSDDDVPIIWEYIAHLRSDLIQGKPPFHSEYGLPIPNTIIPIFDRIKDLPNPSKLAPNQPRDRYYDKLELPQNGVGVQCDINFSAHLGLQNSLLLRCYSFTDPRVRPMVLFVKHWAKARGINTPYRGTLSSYGYVLMVLHYLVNVAQPFVSPNLQLLAPPDPDLPPEALEGIATCRGRNVRFWRDEEEIQRLARDGVLNQNKESIGSLLRGFFEYYAHNKMMSSNQKRGFEWGREVLSLRTPGGLLTKLEKDWVSAKTTMQLTTGAPPTPTEVELQGNLKSPTEVEVQAQLSPDFRHDQSMSPDGSSKRFDESAKPKEFKEVRHRFLFAIEDPFEHEHNVARTVTHNGIVSIRDEFRRAWQIIKAAGKDVPGENLLADLKQRAELVEKNQFVDLLTEIHGGGGHLE
ncbi:cid13-like poly(A) RNA polymerase [Xylariales sp. AK1849]|nr:cid13-like poly(A) RNA polymerase [Xylariales sp. AK1849]